MRKMIVRVLGLVLLSCLGFVSAPAGAESALSPMWVARAPDGAQVYLFGSIHVCNASCFPLPQKALQRLSESKVLVIEMDPRQPDAQRALMDAAMLPPGQRLSRQLHPQDWDQLRAVASRIGVPVEMFDPMQPWMASMMLSVMAAQQAGYAAAEGIDLAFMTRARELGLRLEELENVQIQIAALSAGSLQAQQDALRLTLQQLQEKDLKAYLSALLGAWRDGRMDELERLVHETMPADPVVSRALLEDRNHRMVERLLEAMQDGQTRFVVVGAAHLLGKEGLPALLAEKGFKVRQVLRDE